MIVTVVLPHNINGQYDTFIIYSKTRDLNVSEIVCKWLNDHSLLENFAAIWGFNRGAEGKPGWIKYKAISRFRLFCDKYDLNMNDFIFNECVLCPKIIILNENGERLVRPPSK